MAITVLRAGVTEEVFYRGYAHERLQSLTGRRSLAVVLTIIPFALFHFRQGPAGILIAGVMGLILALIYLKRRSLPAVMFTHFTVDFVPNVLLPLLGFSNSACRRDRRFTITPERRRLTARRRAPCGRLISIATRRSDAS